MISKGAITKRANEERLPAQTIERDYVLANLCADIGAIGDPRFVFKGGTLLRLCYFEPYRYSADLDFSAVDGLSWGRPSPSWPPRPGPASTVSNCRHSKCRRKTGAPPG